MVKRKIVKTKVVDEPHGMTGISRIVKVDASEFKEGQQVKVVIESMHGYDTVVQCKKCGHKEYLEFINGLRNGWNQCCGQTMPILKTTANIQEVMHKLLKGMGI